MGDENGKEEHRGKTVHRTTPFGELVVAVFDKATQYSTDPHKVSRMATRAVANIVRRARKLTHAPERPE